MANTCHEEIEELFRTNPDGYSTGEITLRIYIKIVQLDRGSLWGSRGCKRGN
jgi:hypothetical protein